MQGRPRYNGLVIEWCAVCNLRNGINHIALQTLTNTTSTSRIILITHLLNLWVFGGGRGVRGGGLFRVMGDTLGKLPLALYASDANWGHRGLSSLLNTLA